MLLEAAVMALVIQKNNIKNNIRGLN